MSNQCKNCGRSRDLNNNYTSYVSGYPVTTSGTNNPNNRCNMSSTQTSTTTSSSAGTVTPMSKQGINGLTHVVTAKVMWGTVGAIKELREKEQAEKQNVTRAGKRQ